MPAVFVILGAAVWADGVASNAMQRRVRGALASACEYPDAIFIPSGGVGRNPPSEARVMAELLRKAGIAETNILLDEASKDTLSSVRNCVRILRSLPGVTEVVICSDTYHIPRCRWLFRLYGISTRAGRVESGGAQNHPLRWAYYHLREVAAFPFDTMLALVTPIACPVRQS